MRILVHDYAGHPFQVQLSRELAQRGHRVLHLFSRSILTPQGQLVKLDGDADTFDVCGIALRNPVKKYGFFSRRAQDIEHGRLAAEQLRKFGPDIVISGNTWLDAQSILLHETRRVGAKFVYWVQDLFGIGIKRVLSKKIPVFGHMVGWYYTKKEGNLLRRSDFVVGITDDFLAIFAAYGVPRDRVATIENWAPLEDVPVVSKRNTWAEKHGLGDKFCFLYSGTMGMKHNPQLIVELAKEFLDSDDVVIIVISEGLGAEYLMEKKREANLKNLYVLGFQPFEELPYVLGSADVLMAVLETDAGVFSVPSKVLTYMCAKRPLLLAVPPENLASRIVERNQAGLTVHPWDAAGFVAAARRLYEDQMLRGACARNARQYAEKTFDIDRVTDRFEGIFVSLVSDLQSGGRAKETVIP